ncbi:hypothetical protein PCE1_001817 [Barthelona sp. PCE]
MSLPFLRLLGVARHNPDKAQLCLHTNDLPRNQRNSLTQLVESILDRLDPSTTPKLTLEDDAGTVCCQSDHSCIYIAVFEPNAPVRVIQNLFREFQTSFNDKFAADIANSMEGSLTRPTKVMCEQLFSKFSSSEDVDVLSRTKAQIAVTTDVMTQNVNKLNKNLHNLHSVVDETENLRVESQGVDRNAATLKKIMFWRNFRMTLVLTITVIAIVGYILLGLL